MTPGMGKHSNVRSKIELLLHLLRPTTGVVTVSDAAVCTHAARGRPEESFDAGGNAAKQVSGGQ